MNSKEIKNYAIATTHFILAATLAVLVSYATFHRIEQIEANRIKARKEFFMSARVSKCDVNADGLDDLVLSDPLHPDEKYVLYGTSNGGYTLCEPIDNLKYNKDSKP